MIAFLKAWIFLMIVIQNHYFIKYIDSDIKKGLNGLAFNSISSLAMSNQMIIKIIKYL
jgi:hypothetical protein